ncbi:MAG: hypothetical protein ABI026_04715 [Gemmatimonadaceae bacterium]
MIKTAARVFEPARKVGIVPSPQPRDVTRVVNVVIYPAGASARSSDQDCLNLSGTVLPATMIIDL